MSNILKIGDKAMKKIMMVAMMMVMTISAKAMSYNAAKHEALFLSDKMAYELNLTAAQFDDVYEINLDYLMSLRNQSGLPHECERLQRCLWQMVDPPQQRPEVCADGLSI